MVRIEVTQDTEVIAERTLEQGQELTLGRRPDSTVVLKHPGVSSSHARLTYEYAPFVEDMGSTNGTFVNGKRITRTLLMGGDRVQLGPYLVRVHFADAKADPARTMIFSNVKMKAPMAGILTLSGEKVGEIIELNDPFATLGQPGKHAALVMRKPKGFSVSVIHSSNPAAGDLPTVNGEFLPDQGRMLYDRDLIIVGGVTMKFHADVNEVRTGGF